VVGIRPVREALRARRRALHRLLVREGTRESRPEVAELLEAAREAGLPVERLEPARFERTAPAGIAHQGVLLEAGPLPVVRLPDLVPAGGGECWLLALDGVEDPRNLGALLRVADAAGVRGVLLPERRAAPPTPAAGRASAGALEHVPVAPVPNLARALAELKRLGFWLYGADPAGRDLFELPDRLLDRRMVLVVGAEGRGLRPGVRAALDVVCRVPMQGAVASLNVAAAAAVVLFEWRRRARAAAGLPVILPEGAARL
jgi:23S rRNA (guanosine2251-2'-O)-methyltransferase